MGNIDSRNVISAAFLRSSRTRNVRLFQKSDPNMMEALREQMALNFGALDVYLGVPKRKRRLSTRARNRATIYVVHNHGWWDRSIIDWTTCDSYKVLAPSRDLGW